MVGEREDSPKRSADGSGHVEPTACVSSTAAAQIGLPLELLPLILDKLQWRTRDLAACCLVSHSWRRYATPRLYARLFLRDQQRLIRVFDSLERTPSLAGLVRVLEIRVFPFGLQAEALERLEASILLTLQSAFNLNELYWTRTGSLTDRVIPFLPTLPRLHTLELTGSSRFYSPANVTRHLLQGAKTPNLRHFAIVLPDRDVVAELPSWAEALGDKLLSFSVLCQHSALVNDDVLKSISEHLTGLTRLSVAGCKTVTGEGIVSLLKASRCGIQDLAIEGLAIHPDSFEVLSKHLTQLCRLSLTFPRHSLCPAAEFWLKLGCLVEDLPNLQEFTHYTSSWMTPAAYPSTLDSDEDMLEDGEEEGGASDQDDEHGMGTAMRAGRFSGLTPQEYRRYELEEHASNGRPIVREPRLMSSFLKRLISARGAQLTKIRIHGVVMRMDLAALIAEGCPNLRDLVVHLYEGETMALQRILPRLQHLRSLHVLSSLYSNVYLSEDNLRTIAAACSSSLRQIGFRNRVWLVERLTVDDGPGEKEQMQVSAALDDGRRLFLRRWDMTAGTFPEVLLVVRACKYQAAHCRSSLSSGHTPRR